MLKSCSTIRSVLSRSISTRQLIYETHGAPEKMIKLKRVELPDKLESEQVLVEWKASPINPADINHVQGVYADKPNLPANAGMEGVARVAKVGSAVKSLKEGDQVIIDYHVIGSWAEHGIYSEKDLIPIDNGLPLEYAAFLKVNPPSAYFMLKEFANLKPGDWVLQNCANSAVGKQVIQISRILGFKTFNVVRNRENIEGLVREMKGLGADEVITEEEMFDRKKTKLPRVKLALNGVGGKSSVFLASALKPGGCMVTYGGMSKQTTQSPTASLIFNDISLRGFWLKPWSHQKKAGGELQKVFNKLSGWMKSGEIVKPDFVERSLEEHVEALAEAQINQTIRARAGSTPGLDSRQIHSLINRNNAFTRILCKDSDTVDSPIPTLPSTRSSSVISIISSASFVDGSQSSGRLIKVAPAKVRHSKSASRWQGLCHSVQDTVSLLSDDSSSLSDTPRTITSASNIEFTDDDSLSLETLSPTSLNSPTDSPDEVFEKVKSAIASGSSTPPALRSSLPFRSLYLDEVVWQIDDVVFASAIDAVNNNSLMCRLNIEFICEIADENADHVQETRRQNRGFDCPCFCSRASSHFRYYLSYSLPETEQRCMQLSTEDTKLNEMFEGFIDLVHRAQKARKNVLVCSTRGRNRAPAFASAYLMKKELISRQTAVAKVRTAMNTMRPPVNISDFMQRKLMRFQQHIGVDPSNAYDPAHTLPLFQVKRSAWT
ncbi:unnamed protein product [Caenorhabditis sp. 36 PRJEB53466]|nr:unnamed protein product [Caenorhabditis sp. 36 PRJEB53466]